MVSWERVEEGISWGSPCLRCAGRPSPAPARVTSAPCGRAAIPRRGPFLVEANPDVYRLTPRYPRSPRYLLVWLDLAEEEDVWERLIDAQLAVAPKRLVSELREA